MNNLNDDKKLAISKIGEPLSFDQNGKKITVEEDEGSWDLSENTLLEVLWNAENSGFETLASDYIDPKNTFLAELNSSQNQSRISKVDIRKSVLKLVNRIRRKHNRSPVRLNLKLTKVAQSHSKDMAKHRKMSHVGSDGSNLVQRIQRSGYKYRACAENIARGQSSSREVMQSWIKSRGHRKNILSSKYSDIGIGIAYMRGGPYWTQVFGSQK